MHSNFRDLKGGKKVGVLELVKYNVLTFYSSLAYFVDWVLSIIFPEMHCS